MKPQFYGRYIVIGSLLGLMCLLILVWVLRIQNSKVALELLTSAEPMAGSWQVIKPARGAIFDRNGHLLAGNEEVYEVGINLAAEPDAKTVATVVSQVTGADYADVLAAASIKYDANHRYAVLDSFVTAEEIKELERLIEEYGNQVTGRRKKDENAPSLRGLMWTPHLKRSYPEGALASNILGFYAYRDRENGRGYFGIEEKYDQLLSGSARKVYISNDPTAAQELPDIEPGASLILTIDRAIQAAVEKQLDKALADSGAEAGTIIVSDPQSGEIMAMASTPRMDLNEYWKNTEVYPNATQFNRAIATTYEPGSVFKIITMASALDAGVVQAETPYLDTGVFEIGGVYIYNWDGGAWGPQDMTGCMRHSLNVCLAWVASELGSDRFYEYLRNFGIGHQTGIDLAGEVYYPLRLPGDEWYEIDLGTNSFGQGLAVTPIQMVMAAGAIANDGKMMAPHLLKAMVNNGRQYNTSQQVVGMPISADTAHTLTSMLARSVTDESYEAALVNGYRIAGKTGTAEIPTPAGYSMAVTNASFVGWGPIDDPQFLVYVWLEKPTVSKWGSVVAAPVFRDVVKELVVLMDLPPDDIRQQLNNQ